MFTLLFSMHFIIWVSCLICLTVLWNKYYYCYPGLITKETKQVYLVYLFIYLFLTGETNNHKLSKIYSVIFVEVRNLKPVSLGWYKSVITVELLPRILENCLLTFPAIAALPEFFVLWFPSNPCLHFHITFSFACLPLLSLSVSNFPLSLLHERILWLLPKGKIQDILS